MTERPLPGFRRPVVLGIRNHHPMAGPIPGRPARRNGLAASPVVQLEIASPTSAAAPLRGHGELSQERAYLSPSKSREPLTGFRLRRDFAGSNQSKWRVRRVTKGPAARARFDRPSDTSTNPPFHREDHAINEVYQSLQRVDSAEARNDAF